MAIYHLKAKVFSRSKGHSAVAAAAYRARERLTDERTGNIYDYSRRRDIEGAEIITPKNAPQWTQNRHRLWEEVERAEDRHNNKSDKAQVAREVEVSLPIELNHDAKKALVREFVNENFVSKGMVADISYHNFEGDNRNNPHAHIMLTMRELDEEEFAAKKNRDWNKKELLEYWREQWANITNKHLEQEGYHARISHKTLEAQGINRMPQIHKGKAHHMNDDSLERMEEWHKRQAVNDNLEQTERELDSLNRKIVRMRRKLKNTYQKNAYKRLGREEARELGRSNQERHFNKYRKNERRRQRIADLKEKHQQQHFTERVLRKPIIPYENERSHHLYSESENRTHQAINQAIPKAPTETSQSDKELERQPPLPTGGIIPGKGNSELTKREIIRRAYLHYRSGWSRERLYRFLINRSHDPDAQRDFINRAIKRAYNGKKRAMQATERPYNPSIQEMIARDLRRYRQTSRNIRREQREFTAGEQYVYQLSRKIANRNIDKLSQSYARGEKEGIRRDMRIIAEMQAHGYTRAEIERALRECSPNLAGRSESERRRYIKFYMDRALSDPRARAMREEVEAFRRKVGIHAKYRRIDTIESIKRARLRDPNIHLGHLKREQKLSDRNNASKQKFINPDTHEKYLKETRGYGRKPANDNQREQEREREQEAKKRREEEEREQKLKREQERKKQQDQDRGRGRRR